jgi:hypothetical protein
MMGRNAGSSIPINCPARRTTTTTTGISAPISCPMTGTRVATTGINAWMAPTSVCAKITATGASWTSSFAMIPSSGDMAVINCPKIVATWMMAGLIAVITPASWVPSEAMSIASGGSSAFRTGPPRRTSAVSRVPRAGRIVSSAPNRFPTSAPAVPVIAAMTGVRAPARFCTSGANSPAIRLTIGSPAATNCPSSGTSGPTAPWMAVATVPITGATCVNAPCRAGTNWSNVEERVPATPASTGTIGAAAFFMVAVMWSPRSLNDALTLEFCAAIAMPAAATAPTVPAAAAEIPANAPAPAAPRPSSAVDAPAPPAPIPANSVPTLRWNPCASSPAFLNALPTSATGLDALSRARRSKTSDRSATDA